MKQENRHLDLVFSELGNTRTLTLPESIDGFLLDLELANRTKDTLAYNRSILSRFRWFADQQPDWPATFDQINKGHITRFISYLANTSQRWSNPEHTRSSRPVKPTTVQRYRAVLHALWNWGMRDELVDSNPVSRVPSPKSDRTIIAPLSEAEIRSLLDSCRQKHHINSRRDLAIVLVLLDTGIRATELCTITLPDWDRQASRLKVMGKGRKERHVSLSPFSAKTVWDYAAKERPESPYQELFLTNEGSPLNRDALEAMLLRRATAAGIRHVHPHLLRHTFAASWCRHRGPINGLQAILGHTTPTMSLRYAEIFSEDAAQLHKQFSPVERLGLRIRERR